MKADNTAKRKQNGHKTDRLNYYNYGTVVKRQPD